MFMNDSESMTLPTTKMVHVDILIMSVSNKTYQERSKQIILLKVFFQNEKVLFSVHEYVN